MADTELTAEQQAWDALFRCTGVPPEAMDVTSVRWSPTPIPEPDVIEELERFEGGGDDYLRGLPTERLLELKEQVEKYLR